MNLVLLGYQPAVLPLLDAITADTSCRVTCVWGESLSTAALEAAPGARRIDDWAELLAPGTVDAVIVAGGDEDTLGAAKHLFAAGRPLLVVPHSGQDSSWMYELSLQWADARAALMPFFPHREDANVRGLRAALADGTIGTPRSLEMERLIAADRHDSPLLSAEEIDAALLKDADLLRFLAGRYTQVTALRTGDGAPGCLRAMVTLAGNRLPEATWTARPSADAPGYKLTVAGEAGSATLESSAGDAPSRLTIAGEPRPNDPLSAVGHAARILAAFRGTRDSEPGDADWEDLIRARETVEAGHDSLRRRRTIDLHAGTHSEQTVFKSQMTALGCGVLFLTLLGVIVLSMLDAAFRFPAGIRTILQIAVFLPVFLFLLFQLMYFAARPAREGEKRE
ncbi:MAG: hypothetical protein WD066_09335 [Planctomycetaceae bacterium]